MSGDIAADRLRQFIERVERLEDAKREIADDIKAVYAEAKANGYDTKTMRQIVRLRRMDPGDRREYEALLDLYKGALGMLDGTPLGKWAQRKADGRKPDDDNVNPAAPPAGGAPDAGGDAAAPDDAAPGDAAADPAAAPLPRTADAARAMGRAAAQSGASVTSNPFPARDERRAAWDEGWCAAAGSDGMDVPEFLQPAKKPKAADADDADDAPGAPDDEKRAA